jgi:hypothetical protein
MQLIDFVVFVSLLAPASCKGQPINQACPMSNGTKGNGSGSVERSIEIMYRGGTTPAEKRKIRSTLCTTSTKNLGSPDQELLTVQVTGTAALERALHLVQKNHAVVTARLASKSYIK